MRSALLQPPDGRPTGLGRRRSRPRPRSAPGVMAGLVAGLVAALTLTACGGDATGEPARAYTFRLEAVENGDTYDFVAKDPIDLRAGDRVTFEMVNAGALIHDMQVVHPDGSPVGTTASIGSGGTVSVTVDLTDPGFYRLNCNVDDHLTKYDMQAIVEVKDADGNSVA